jgi:uncharacterized protein (DUF433 family)
MTESPPAYVEQTPAGGWRVAGTRVSLESVVHAYWLGRLPEAIAADFPALTLEQVHGVIAYYLRHQAEIDTYLASQDQTWEQFRQQSAARHGPLLQRVRAAAGQPASGTDS